MNYYIEIELKPDADIRESPLLNLVYSKFHKALVKLKTDKIGVSFPGYQIKLGLSIRIHGDEGNLRKLQEMNWLGGLAGYCKISGIERIPNNVKYRTISRIRTNMSKSKLKRLKKRNSITTGQEKLYKAKMFSKGLDNPYVDLESGSTRQKHRRFFSFGNLVEHPVSGSFDSFGLSKCSTIPWF
jgi:CRISPR-associated endonuclease Csy4